MDELTPKHIVIGASLLILFPAVIAMLIIGIGLYNLNRMKLNLEEKGNADVRE